MEKKIIKSICFYVFLTLILGCASRHKIKTEVFNTEGLNVKVSSVQKQGFTFMRGLDIDIFKKEVKDTLIMLEVNTRFNAIYTKTWRIKMDSIGMNYVGDFFDEKYISLSNSFFQFYRKENSTFYAYSDVDNKTFICDVFNKNGQNYLDIIYHVPVLSRWKVKRKRAIFEEERRYSELKKKRD